MITKRRVETKRVDRHTPFTACTQPTGGVVCALTSFRRRLTRRQIEEIARAKNIPKSAPSTLVAARFTDRMDMVDVVEVKQWMSRYQGHNL